MFAEENVMRRLIWLFLGVWLLAACGASGPSATPGATAVGETAVSPTSDTTTSAAPAPVDAFSGTLEEASIVREGDWVKGATVPVVTIIEYGDFQ